MPIFTFNDWSNGPMGPGFLMLFQGNRDVFYDGGEMFDLIGNDNQIKDKKKREQEYETDILVTMALLMLEQ